MSKLAEKPAAGPVPATRGFSAIEFICPNCGSPFWGTESAKDGQKIGRCNGGQYGYGDCRTVWNRSNDWLMFRRVDGRSFATADEYEATIGRGVLR
jgi:hypothetical protein